MKRYRFVPVFFWKKRTGSLLGQLEKAYTYVDQFNRTRKVS